MMIQWLVMIKKKEEEVTHQSDDNFIDDGINFHDQDAQAYRIPNIIKDLKEAMNDKIMIEKLGLCSDPENYTPERYDEVDYEFDGFKRFEKKIKRIVGELKTNEVTLHDSFHNAVVLGKCSKLRDVSGEKRYVVFEETNIGKVLGKDLYDTLKDKKLELVLDLNLSHIQ